MLRIACAAVAALLLSTCSQTPTAPSAVAPAALLETPTALLPAPLTIVPPRALGLTRFVAFGDSITWGATSAWFSAYMYAAANGGYPERLEVSLNTFHSPQRFTVFNEGLPGELAVNALSRFRSVLTTRRPQAVLLLEGINDLSNDISVSRTIDGLRAMLDAAAVTAVPVLVGTMYPTYAVTDPTGFYRHNGSGQVLAFNTEVRRLLSGRQNVYLVDLEPLMGNRALVGTDGIHLENLGFDVVTSAFLDAIRRAFPVRGSFQ
ncbi:MAG: SGNH/GDSL hydrolase family protein [Acidobacteriota bacterium]